MDLWLILMLTILISIGIIAIYSSCIKYELQIKYVFMQFIACLLGILAMLLLANLNYQYYKQFDKFVYIVSILLLILVLVFGSYRRGTKGWFNFGPMSFQPVEIAKIMFILVMSSFLDKKANKINELSFLFYVFIIFICHLILIMMQPDFSSTLVYFPVTLLLLFTVGVKKFYLICILIFSTIAIGLPLLKTFLSMYLNFHQNSFFLYKIIFLSINYKIIIYILLLILLIIIWWILNKFKIKFSIIYPIILYIIILLGNISALIIEKSLKTYQKQRLIVFLNPRIDPKGSGYNIIQSKIAIGAGKFFGKGIKNGTQTQLGFIPEQHTDFIFTVIGEESGWIGSQLTLIFYFIFIFRCLVIAKESYDRYGSLIAIGLAAMFLFYVIINIGMVIGIMPVTGIPLLLLSYGGSSMFSSLCAIGILCSIHARRHVYFQYIKY
jgi:rod shape determining protein RodA